MTSLSRRWIAIGALLAAIGVGLGAYSAHGLHDRLAALGYTGDDLARRLGIWDIAIRYQMFHAIGIVLIGLALAHRDAAAWRLVPWAFLVGIILFCGSLKFLTFAGESWKWLGAVTPFGGFAMIVGWVTFAICAWTCKD